ncbi:MAG: sensor histidine kinase, partial [Anaerolineales bacterium]|nr:sensor histidine kinase [Anaerolineales bacterium]
HIVSVEEDARKKLARDLHDGPTQDIASIAMRVNTIRMLFDRDPSRVPDELVQVEQMARRTTTKIRHMLFTLRPLILESQGLYAALEQYISKLAELDSVAIHLEALRGVDQAISRRAQSVVFYIIEEAVSNARRHANPSTIWVRLRLEGDVFVAEVEDDGAGFDFQAVRTHYDERGSLGVVTMHERTDLVDGKLVIDTAPGNGTLVRLSVPVRRL